MEPFPFQLICFISSEVCFHHLLPGHVRDGDIGFQGLFDHLSRRIQVIDIQQITHLCPLQIDRSTSRNHLSVNNFHSTHRPASSTQRRLFAKQPHIGTPYGHTESPIPCTKGRYRAMAHRNHQHCAHTATSCAAIWRNTNNASRIKHLLWKLTRMSIFATK